MRFRLRTLMAVVAGAAITVACYVQVRMLLGDDDEEYALGVCIYFAVLSAVLLRTGLGIVHEVKSALRRRADLAELRRKKVQAQSSIVPSAAESTAKDRAGSRAAIS